MDFSGTRLVGITLGGSKSGAPLLHSTIASSAQVNLNERPPKPEALASRLCIMFSSHTCSKILH